jgi:SNF family Na+-dependent transporter
VVIVTASLMFLFGLIFCFNGGVYMFRLFDSSVPSWNQLLLGLLEVTLISYVYKIDLFMEVFREMNINMNRAVKAFWKVGSNSLSLNLILISDLLDVHHTTGLHHPPGGRYLQPRG